MKLTIENEWPANGTSKADKVTISYDTGRWDDSLDGAVSAFAGLLKAFGFHADSVDERLHPDEVTDCDCKEIF